MKAMCHYPLHPIVHLASSDLFEIIFYIGFCTLILIALITVHAARKDRSVG